MRRRPSCWRFPGVCRTAHLFRKEKLDSQETNKKRTAKKPVVKLPDLPPRKDAKGGGQITSRNPALQIPPPGFISSTENGESKGGEA